jgi:hypothetical protein
VALELAAELLDGVAHAGRRLGVDDGDEPRARIGVDRVEERLVGGDLPVVGADLDHLRARALGHARDAVAEEPRDGDDGGVARLEQVHEPALHARRPGRLMREDEAALGVVDPALEVDELEQDLVEIRVEVAQHRLLHRLQDGRLDVARARPGEQALRWIEARKVGRRGHRRKTSRKVR